MRILGIILISIGLLTLALPYLTFTKREKVLDIGPVEAVAETKERIPVSPVLGAIILVAGAGIVIASVMKKLGVTDLAMKFRVRSPVTYEIRSPARLLVNVRAHSSRSQKLIREQWRVSPRVGLDPIVTEPEAIDLTVTKFSRIGT